MPNIPFASFPSFASVTRFEHSVGVSHLAWWWAKRNHLPNDSAEALAIAGLYHDAATPAFSHLFEEFLHRHGFDHETALADLLVGRTTIPGSYDAQVFLGRKCMVPVTLPVLDDPQSLLTVYGISGLATAKTPLGRALHGQIDLDNIDNVIRAVTAMGLISEREAIHPYQVAAALVFEDGEVRFDPHHSAAVLEWRNLRRLLYSAILNNEHEFLVQTTIKWAIEACAKNDPELKTSDAWVLTELELVFEHLNKDPFAARLVSRVRLNQPPPLLLSAWIPDLSRLLGPDSGEVTEKIVNELSALSGRDVYVNFYVDKRERQIDLPTTQEDTLFHQFDIGSNRRAEPSSMSLPVSTPGVPGILGAVSLSRSTPDNSDARRGGRQLDLHEAADMLARCLGLPPKEISHRWLGRQRPRGGSRKPV